MHLFMLRDWITSTISDSITSCNGVARTLKTYAHQGETTGTNSDSLQLRPFSKWEFRLKQTINSFLLEQFLFGMETHLYLIR